MTGPATRFLSLGFARQAATLKFRFGGFNRLSLVIRVFFGVGFPLTRMLPVRINRGIKGAQRLFLGTFHILARPPLRIHASQVLLVIGSRGETSAYVMDVGHKGSTLPTTTQKWYL